MSYNTVYSLEWPGDRPTMEDIVTVLVFTSNATNNDASQNPGSFEEHARTWRIILEGSDETTWYEHQEDMARISRIWPGVVFTLNLNGEDSRDFLKEYYLNGKVQTAPGEIVYEKFQPEKLAEPNGTGPEPAVSLENSPQTMSMPQSPQHTDSPQAGPTTADRTPEFQLTELNLREEARSQVLNSLHDTMANLKPGALHREMADMPEARERVAGYVQEWIDRIESRGFFS